MALFSTIRLLIKREAFQSELLLKSINCKPNISMTELSAQYIQSLRTVKFKSESDASEYFNFPHSSFHQLPMKSIIEESFNIMKEKGFIKSSRFYIKLLGAHMLYDVDIDIKEMLNEIKENQIEISELLYNVIIKYLSLHGEMSTFEIIRDTMESENVQLNEESKFLIVSGYIISGQPDKSKDFVSKNQLDQNYDAVMYAEMTGYGYNGDVDNVINIINKMKEKHSHLESNHIWLLYRDLIKAKVSEKQLEQIIDLTKNAQIPDETVCVNTILNLARNEYLNYSTVKLIENFRDCFRDKANIITMTFRKPTCPPDIYKSVLKLLIDDCIKHKDVSLFFYMNFDDAFEFANATINATNLKTVSYSLANKALEDRSSGSIETALNFMMKALTTRDLNHFLQFKLIPALLSSSFTDNCEDIIYLFPKHENVLYPSILMHCLCLRDFQTFNKLMARRSKSQKIIGFNTNWSYLSGEIMNSFSLQDIEILKLEAQKCFNFITIISLLSNFLMRKIEILSKNNDLDEIKKCIKFIKKHNLRFRDFEIATLSNLPPNHVKLLKSNGIL